MPTMVATTESVSNEAMEQKITAQIEYYFDDLNIKHDKFIKYHMKQDDGWFPLEKLMTFNRLKSLTEEKDVVIRCIKNSTSGLIELNEDGTKIRRSKPIPEESEEYIKELNLRTLHLKGFPKDSKLDDIMDFCAEFGKVQSLQMRRNMRKDKEFKGCILVTYLAQEDADKVLAAPELKYKEIELLRENKEQYLERKKNFYESLNKKRKEKQSGVVSDEDLVKTKGAILKITGLNKETKFADIKEELAKHSKVAFVTNVNDQSECHVRFADENGAKEALKALKGQTEDNSEESEKISIELCGQKVEVILMSEEEEKEFWREYHNKQQQQHFGGNKKNKWQKGKKRFGNDNGGGRKNKMAKTDNGGKTESAKTE